MRGYALLLSLLCLFEMGCMQSYILSRSTFDNEKRQLRHSKQAQRLFYILPKSAVDSRQETLYVQGKLGITTEKELFHILKQTSNDSSKIRYMAAWALEYVDEEVFLEERRWKIIEHLCRILQEETSLEAIAAQAKTISRLLSTIQPNTTQKVFVLNAIDEQIYKLPTNNIPITLLLIKKHIQTPSVILEISQNILQQSNWESYQLSRISDILHFLQLQDGKTSHIHIYENLMKIYENAPFSLRFSILQSFEKNHIHIDDIIFLKNTFAKQIESLSPRNDNTSNNLGLEWALILRWLISIDEISPTKRIIATTMQNHMRASRTYADIIFHKKETDALNMIWMQQ
jgi:hypothetical protein